MLVADNRSIQLCSVSVTAFDVTVWGTGQTFSYSNGLGAPKWDHAHPVALGKYYRIIQHMKSTLVTLLSITHLSLPLVLPLALSSFLSPSLTGWHVVMCSHSE